MVRRVADRYELRRLLGRGGAGAVWLARDTLLDRDVAIKEILVPGHLDEAERAVVRARVVREARAAARLNHPGVITVFDIVHDDATAFLIMELVQAPTLSEVVDRGGPMSPQRAAAIGLQLLAALEAAHAAGIVHRDVKPGNVMVREGPAPGSVDTVLLADFGVAAITDDPRLTTTGLIIGSPSFMSPEQARGQLAGPEVDLWGLGATLWYAVEGSPPFERPATLATLHAVVSEEPPPPRRAGALGPTLLGLLAKDPSVRPSGAPLRDALTAAAAAPAPAPAPEVPAGDEPEPEPEPAPRGGRATMTTAAAAPAAATAAGGQVERVDPADEAGRPTARAGEADRDAAVQPAEAAGVDVAAPADAAEVERTAAPPVEAPGAAGDEVDGVDGVAAAGAGAAGGEVDEVAAAAEPGVAAAADGQVDEAASAAVEPGVAEAAGGGVDGAAATAAGEPVAPEAVRGGEVDRARAGAEAAAGAAAGPVRNRAASADGEAAGVDAAVPVEVERAAAPREERGAPEALLSGAPAVEEPGEPVAARPDDGVGRAGAAAGAVAAIGAAAAVAAHVAGAERGEEETAADAPAEHGPVGAPGADVREGPAAPAAEGPDVTAPAPGEGAPAPAPAAPGSAEPAAQPPAAAAPAAPGSAGPAAGGRAAAPAVAAPEAGGGVASAGRAGAEAGGGAADGVPMRGDGSGRRRVLASVVAGLVLLAALALAAVLGQRGGGEVVAQEDASPGAGDQTPQPGPGLDPSAPYDGAADDTSGGDDDGAAQDDDAEDSEGDGAAGAGGAPSTGDRDDPTAEGDGDAPAPGDPAPAPVNAAPAIPADWVRYTDDEIGYSLAHPPGWTVERRSRTSTTTDFREPGTGTYLRVDYTPDPPADAVADWTEQSRAFGARRESYTEIAIRPVEFRGLPAAVWEYEYTEGGARLRASNLGVNTGDYGYGLNFQTRAENWEASQELAETLLASFSWTTEGPRPEPDAGSDQPPQPVGGS